MTQEIPAPPPFETRCPRCRVSYPIETRRCVHCGGATERPSGPTPAPGVALGARTQARGPVRPGRLQAPPPLESEADDDEALPRRGFGRGVGLIWVALALAASIYRACTGGGGPG